MVDCSESDSMVEICRKFGKTKHLIQTKQKKSLMKPDTFNFKFLSACLLQLYPLHLIISLHVVFDRKTQKTVYLQKLEMK